MFLQLAFSLHQKMLIHLRLLQKMTNMDLATKGWTHPLHCLAERTGLALILCQPEQERKASLGRYNLILSY